MKWTGCVPFGNHNNMPFQQVLLPSASEIYVPSLTECKLLRESIIRFGNRSICAATDLVVPTELSDIHHMDHQLIPCDSGRHETWTFKLLWDLLPETDRMQIVYGIQAVMGSRSICAAACIACVIFSPHWVVWHQSNWVIRTYGRALVRRMKHEPNQIAYALPAYSRRYTKINMICRVIHFIS